MSHPTFNVAGPIAYRPVQVTAVTQTSAGVLSPNPALAVMRPPIFPWPQLLARPRGAFDLPTLISASPAPNDTTLFEEPRDAAKQHYLQHYAIALQGTATRPTNFVSLAPSSKGFELTVHLAVVAALDLPAGAVPIVPTSVRYFLTATLLGRSVSWDFTVSASTATTLTLAVTVTGTSSRDSLYHAMTDPAANAQLMIRSAFPVASVLPPNVPANPPAPPVYRIGPPTVDMAIPFTFDPDLNPNIFSAITGVSSSGSSTWSHQAFVWNQRSYGYYYDEANTSQVFYLPDSFKISRQAVAPHAPSLQVTTSGSDPASLSFTLSFIATPVTSLARLQDAISQLTTHFGFPADVQLAPFEASKTALALTLPSADGTSAPGLQPVTGATIDIGAGVVGAVTLTLSQMQEVYAALFDDVSALLSGVVTVTVNPTDTEAPTIPLKSRANDFAGDIFTITTAVDTIYNAVTANIVNAIESPIHITAAPVMLAKGGVPVANVSQRVSVTPPVDLLVGGTASTPSTAQDDLAGWFGNSPASTTDGSGSPSTGGALADNLGGVLGGVLGGILGGVPVSNPPAIAPPPPADPPATPVLDPTAAPAAPPVADHPVSQSLFVAFRLPAGATVDHTYTVLPDYTAVRVLPDAGAIWDAIASNQVVSPIKHTIRIIAFNSLFAPAPAVAVGPADVGSEPPSPPPATILAAQVVFSSGETADFDASTPASNGVMTRSISLSVPLKTYVLQSGDTSEYRYRVDLITTAGRVQGNWITSNQDSFYVQANG